MRTHRWIRLSFLNFPSNVLSVCNVCCSVQIDDITRTLCRECKKCALDFPAIHHRKHTYICAPFLNCYTQAFSLRFLSFSSFCPFVSPLVFWSLSLGLHFFSFFSNLCRVSKAADKKGEKTHKNTSLGLLYSYSILSFVLRLGALCLRWF